MENRVDFYIKKFLILDQHLIEYIKKYVSNVDIKVTNGFYVYNFYVYMITKIKGFEFWYQQDNNGKNTGYSSRMFLPETGKSLLDFGIDDITLNKINFKKMIKSLDDTVIINKYLNGENVDMNDIYDVVNKRDKNCRSDSTLQFLSFSIRLCNG